jgi:UDP-N-acetyl-D-mannosaminuronic acid transferase (WecB/TagA/CpsF family)
MAMKRIEWPLFISKVRSSDRELKESDAWGNIFAQGKSSTNLFVNHYSLTLMERARVDFTGADRILIDGMALAWQCGAADAPVTRRSFDLTSQALPVMDAASRAGYFVAFIGGSVTEAARFRTWLGTHIPKGRFAAFDGFETDRRSVVEALADREKKLMVVFGTGTPYQERDALSAFESCSVMGARVHVFTCGGFISQTAASKDGSFYPPWIEQLHLRWLWRSLKQPFVIKRILLVYPMAILKVAARNRGHFW